MEKKQQTTDAYQDDDVNTLPIVVSNDDFQQCLVDINGVVEEVPNSLLRRSAKPIVENEEEKEEDEYEGEEEEDEYEREEDIYEDIDSN